MVAEILKEWIKEAMTAVTSADKAYAYLKETGRYTPRRKVREAWRTVGQETGWEILLSHLPPGRRIHPAWVIEGTVPFRAPYMGVFEYRLRDPRTGVETVDYLGVTLEKLPTAGEILEVAEDYARSYAAMERAAFVGGQLVGFMRSPGWE